MLDIDKGNKGLKDKEIRNKGNKGQALNT